MAQVDIENFLDTTSESDQADISSDIGVWRSTLVMALFHPLRCNGQFILWEPPQPFYKNLYKIMTNVFKAYKAKPNY